MIDIEPINIRKRMIAAVCLLCVICASWGFCTGYLIASTRVECTENESTSVEEIFEETKSETTEEINECTTAPTEIEVTEPTIEETEVTEPTIEETKYYEPESTETSSINISTPAIDNSNNAGMSDLEMLAIVIYQEVGGDAHCNECRRRVADIVLNRVSSDKFPNTIYEVLTEKGQYGLLYWTGIKWADRASNPNEAHAVKRAWRIAEEVLNGYHSDVYGSGYVWQAGFVQGSDGFWCCGHFFGR